MLSVRKRIYLVNRDFQLRYTFAAVVVGLTATFLTTVIILYPLFKFEILRIPRFLPTPILLGMGLSAVVNILFVVLMGVIITHKIAGPMYSLVRYMRRIELGFFRSFMRQRQGDELKYVVRNFNEMVDGLIKISEDDKLQLEKIESLVNQLPSSGQDEAAKSLLAEIAVMKARIVTRLAEPEAGVVGESLDRTTAGKDLV